MKFLKEDPIAVLVAVGLIAAGVFFGREPLREYLRYPSSPLAVDVAGALSAASDGPQWVSVASGDWRCDQLVRRGVSQLVPAWAPDGSLLVADFQDDSECSTRVGSARVTGIVDALPANLRSALVVNGLTAAADANARRLYVSATDEKKDSLLGILICFLGAPLLALGMFPARRLVGRFQASTRDRLRQAELAPSESVEANQAVRKHGALLFVFSLISFGVGENWALWGVVPVRWFAVGAGALGAGMLVFPKLYRRLARSRR